MLASTSYANFLFVCVQIGSKKSNKYGRNSLDEKTVPKKSNKDGGKSVPNIF